MAKFGKWVGGGLGWVLGGPIGGLIGFSIGSLFDTAEITTLNETNQGSGQGQRRTHSHQTHQYDTQPGDFSVSLIVLSAAIMNADGAVLKSELDYVKSVLNRSYGEQRTKQLLLLLRDLNRKHIDIREVCIQIRQHMDHPSRLQLMHYLFNLSLSDNELQQVELDVLHQIASYLNVSSKDFDSLLAMYHKGSESDYKILEIESNANNEEIKKAYRKMAVKYHPDKVSHLGEEHQKSAKEKFQKVQQAYENIKKKRGMNLSI